MWANRVWYKWEEQEVGAQCRSPHRARSLSAPKPHGSRVDNAEVKVSPNASVLAAVIVLAGTRSRLIDLAATGRAVQVDAIAVESPGNAIRPGPDSNGLLLERDPAAKGRQSSSNRLPDKPRSDVRSPRRLCARHCLRVVRCQLPSAQSPRQANACP